MKAKSTRGFIANLLLALVLLTSLNSCNSMLGGNLGNPRSPCQWPRKWFRLESRETCINRSYLGYKPVVKDGQVAWKLCSVKRNWEKLKLELFVCSNNGEPLKGLPNNFTVDMLGQYQYSVGDYGGQGSNLPKLLSIGEIRAGSKVHYNTVKQAFDYCPNYAHIKDEAIQRECELTYNCLRTETENKLDNCLHRENGGKAEGTFADVRCPKDVSLNQNTGDMFDPTNQRYTQLQKGIGILYNHYDAAEVRANYILDAQKDLTRSSPSTLAAPRYAYLKLQIGTDNGIGDMNHKYKIAIFDNNDAAVAKDEIYLYLENQQGLRYCYLDDNGMKTFVVALPISSNAAGQTIQLLDYNLGNSVTATAAIGVSAADQLLSRAYTSSSRRLTVNAIRLPITNQTYVKRPLSVSFDPGSSFTLPSMGACRLKSSKFNTLEKALEDAFALDVKTSASSVINTVHPSVDVTVASCNLTDLLLQSRFLDNGDMILKVDDLWQKYLDLERPSDVSRVYLGVLGDIAKDLYKAHSNGCRPGELTNIERQLTAVLTSGIQLGDRFNLPASDEDEGAPRANAQFRLPIDLNVIASPQTYFADPVTRNYTFGVTLPFQPVDPDLNALEYMTTVFIFARHFYQYGVVTSNNGIDPRTLEEQISSHATMCLAHELCHSWTQNYMMGPTQSGLENHRYFCAGYNFNDCNFTDRKYTNGSYIKFDDHGIVFCEGHRQIFFNQLMRKYFK